jgi:PAS domain S-box-containing protein
MTKLPKVSRVSKVSNFDEVLRGSFEASQDLMTVADADGRLLYVSAAGREILGLEPEQCVGLLAWSFVHPEDLEPMRAAFLDLVGRTGRHSCTFENRQVSRNGVVTTMLWTHTRQEHADGTLSCIASCGRDITALKNVERELERSRVRYESVLAGMLDPVITIDATGIIQDANESCAHVLGYPPDELIGRNVKILLPEPYRSEHDDYLERYRRTGHTHILGRTREFPVLRKGGAQIECELSVSRIDIAGQEPLFCGSFRDITDRKAMQRALAESEHRFRAIFDQEYQFVGLLSPEGILLEANRTSLDAVGIERADVIGRPFWDTPWWAHSKVERERVQQAVRDAANGTFVRFETTHARRGGGVLHVDFSLKPVRDQQGEIALLLPEGRDITDFKLSQQRETAMMRAFADIGESASILAHEIKNPITAVNLALRAVAKHLGEDESAVLSELVERMRKLEKLMRRTLSLARPLELSTTASAPGDLLENAIELLKPHLQETEIEVESSVAEGCAMVAVDRDLFEEVLTNLIRNSIEAMQPGGRIRIAAEAAKEGVMIRVEDDGPGIPEHILSTLFKPFVTTKSDGTGLGLAIARKIVEAHGGTLEAADSPLGGARFNLFLPAAVHSNE